MNADAVTLRAAVLPRAGALTEAALVAGGVGLLALSAQVSVQLPFTPVPVTGQTGAVLLLGSAYGLRRGLLTMALYLLAGVAGLPFWSLGRSGGHIFLTATGGYLVGMLLATALTGYLAERGWDKRLGTTLWSMLGGTALVYVFGTGWLMAVTGWGLGKGLEKGVLPFLVGDALKLALATALLPAAWQLVRRFSR